MAGTDKSGVSRRNFLRGAGAGVATVATAPVLPAPTAAAWAMNLSKMAGIGFPQILEIMNLVDRAYTAPPLAIQELLREAPDERLMQLQQHLGEYLPIKHGLQGLEEVADVPLSLLLDNVDMAKEVARLAGWDENEVVALLSDVRKHIEKEGIHSLPQLIEKANGLTNKAIDGMRGMVGDEVRAGMPRILKGEYALYTPDLLDMDRKSREVLRNEFLDFVNNISEAKKEATRRITKYGMEIPEGFIERLEQQGEQLLWGIGDNREEGVKFGHAVAEMWQEGNGWNPKRLEELYHSGAEAMEAVSTRRRWQALQQKELQQGEASHSFAVTPQGAIGGKHRYLLVPDAGVRPESFRRKLDWMFRALPDASPAASQPRLHVVQVRHEGRDAFMLATADAGVIRTLDRIAIAAMSQGQGRS